MPTDPTTANLIAYWSMDETSGTRADSHTGGLDLTDNNTVGYATGVQSNAGQFVRANSEYLSRADAAAISPTSAMSMSAWMYRDSGSASYYPICKGTYSSDWAWFLAFFADGRPIVYVATAASDPGNTYGLYGSDVIGTSAWHHIAIVYDGAGSGNSGRLKLYVDGSEITLTYTGTIPASLRDDAGPLHIGGLDGFGGYWDGRIDEVAYFDDALTADEVSWLYNAGAGRTYADLGGGGGGFQPAWAAGCNVFRGVL